MRPDEFKPSLLAWTIAMVMTGVTEKTSAAGQSGNGVPSLKISGQVNRAILYMDNDDSTDVQYVDNSASGTRFRFTGDTKLDNGLKVGFVIENQYQDNRSSRQDVKSPDNNGSFRTRRQQVWVAGGFGKVGLGQSQGAADGTTEVDYSNTQMTSYVKISTYGGISFRNNGEQLAVPSQIAQVINSFDHNGRYDNLRYDTPSLGPVTLALSAGNDRQDAAARLATSFGDTKLAAAMGWSRNNEGSNGDQPDFKTYGGSVSLLLTNGTNLTFSGSVRDFDNNAGTDDGKVWYVKLGRKIGKHSLSVDYGKGDDQLLDGDEASRYGLAYNYDFPSNKVQVYAGVNRWDLDRDNERIDDITTLIVGSRLKF